MHADWVKFRQSFSFTYKHKNGKENVVVNATQEDTLSSLL